MMRALPGACGALLLVLGCGTSDENGVTQPATAPASIAISPSNPTVSVGSTLQLAAIVRDSHGTVLTQAPVNWSVLDSATGTETPSGLVSVNANGLFTAGSVSGQYQVYAQLVGGTLTDTADVFVSSTPPSTSNEPAGFVPFAIHNFSTMPTFPRSVGGVLGSWWNYPVTNSNSTLTIDPSAPLSPDSVHRTRYPTNFPAGSAPVNVGGWDIRGALTPFKKIYVSQWIKIEGPDFENERAGTKAGFIGVANRNSGHAELFWWLDNEQGVQRVQSTFRILFKQQGITQPNGNVVRNMVPNVNRTHIMTAGTWHHWESIMELNTLGQANGIFKMWIDGVMTHNYSDVTYIYSGATLGFNDWKWNPTWGGQNGNRTRTDYILIDHIYISGIE